MASSDKIISFVLPVCICLFAKVIIIENAVKIKSFYKLSQILVNYFIAKLPKVRFFGQYADVKWWRKEG